MHGLQLLTHALNHMQYLSPHPPLPPARNPNWQLIFMTYQPF